MFESCPLTSIDLSFLKGGRGIMYTNGMFKNCKKLKSVDFPNLETYTLFETSEMFLGCSELTSINLTNLATPQIYNVSKMFSGCVNLKYLDIIKFNTENLDDSNCNFFDGLRTNEMTILYDEKKNTCITKYRQ